MAKQADIDFGGKLTEALAQSSVADVVRSKEVVVVAASDSVADAFRTLAANKILAVPVVRGEGKNAEAIGDIDVLRIVRFVIEADSPSAGSVGSAAYEAAGKVRPADLESLDLAAVTCAQLLRATGGAAMLPFYAGNPASYLPRLFSNRLHRMIVYADAEAGAGERPETVVAGICSQTDLVAFVHKMMSGKKNDDVARLLEATLEEAGYAPQGAEQLGAVPPGATVLQALQRMALTGYRAVAIAEPEGELAGVFSVTALRGLGQSDIGRLCEPVLEFVRSSEPGALKPHVVRPARDTVGETIARFASGGLHEVWVTDGAGRPTGVLTQTDLLRLLTVQKRLGDAASRRESAKRAFSLPGTLHINVVGGAGLQDGSLFRSIRTCVQVSLNGTDVLFTTPVREGANPGWRTSGRLAVASEMVDAKGAAIVFTVFDESRGFAEAGRFQIPLAWVVDGFGTHSGAMRSFSDSFRVSDKGGEVSVQFLWE